MARAGELPAGPTDDERLGRLLWVAIQRFGPIGFEGLLELVPAEPEAARAGVEELIAQRRVEATHEADGTIRYSSEQCLIAPEDPAGWEAAVFDHFQAVVAALSARLRAGAKDQDDWVGGGTFSFEVWRGHPMFEEAAGLLSQTRSHARALRERIRAFNATHAPSEDSPVRVVFYFGQSMTGADEEEQR